MEHQDQAATTNNPGAEASNSASTSAEACNVISIPTEAPYSEAPYLEAPYLEAPYPEAPSSEAPYSEEPYSEAQCSEPTIDEETVSAVRELLRKKKITEAIAVFSRKGTGVTLQEYTQSEVIRYLDDGSMEPPAVEEIMNAKFVATVYPDLESGPSGGTTECETVGTDVVASTSRGIQRYYFVVVTWMFTGTTLAYRSAFVAAPTVFAHFHIILLNRCHQPSTETFVPEEPNATYCLIPPSVCYGSNENYQPPMPPTTTVCVSCRPRGTSNYEPGPQARYSL